MGKIRNLQINKLLFLEPYPSILKEYFRPGFTYKFFTKIQKYSGKACFEKKLYAFFI
jgi:hypothetical protein